MGTSADSIAQVVKGADIVLVALGSDEKMARENHDMPSIYLPEEQEKLLKKIYQVNPRIVLVFHTGNPLTSNGRIHIYRLLCRLGIRDRKRVGLWPICCLEMKIRRVSCL